MAGSAADDAARESRALIVSLTAVVLMSAMAILWGVVTGARVILFDGVYMLTGIALTGVSLLASRAASLAPSKDYPFGRHAATPLAVALQGAALVGTVVYGAADAVGVLVDGGSPAAAGSVLAYGVVSGLLSLGLVLWLRGAARRSALARAEMVSWRAGVLLSAVVALGGAIAVALNAAGAAGIAAYVDPALVLVAGAFIAPMAVGLVRAGVTELLEAAPPAGLTDRVDALVAEVAAAHRLPAATIRSTVLGRRLYVEVDFLVDRGGWTVDAEDVVRRSVVERLDTLDFEVWATVELTTDRSLID